MKTIEVINIGYPIKLIVIEVETITKITSNTINNFYSFKHKKDKSITKGLIDIVNYHHNLPIDQVVGIYKFKSSEYRRDFFNLEDLIIKPISYRTYLNRAKFLYERLSTTSDLNKLIEEAKKINSYLQSRKK